MKVKNILSPVIGGCVLFIFLISANNTKAQNYFATVPVYRLAYTADCSDCWVKNFRQHFYTTDPKKRAELLAKSVGGYKSYLDEGIAFYILEGKYPGSVPVYRYGRSNKTVDGTPVGKMPADIARYEYFQLKNTAPPNYPFSIADPPVLGYVFGNPTVKDQTTRLFHLYRPPTKDTDEDRFYTISATEKESALKAGYQDLGVVANVWTAQKGYNVQVGKFNLLTLNTISLNKYTDQQNKVSIIGGTTTANGGTLRLFRKDGADCDAEGCKFNFVAAISTQNLLIDGVDAKHLFKLSSGASSSNTQPLNDSNFRPEKIGTFKIKKGVTDVTFIVDPDNKIDESNEKDNEIKIRVVLEN